MDQLIINNYFYYLIVLFILFLSSIIYFRKKIFSNIKISKKTIILLVLIMLFGLALRTFLVPQSIQVFDDEYLYLSNAEEFAFNNNYCTPQQGMEETLCARTPYPAGNPFFYSLFILLLGFSLPVIFTFATLAGTFAILLMFLLVQSIFKDERTSLFSALIISVIPVFIRLAGSSSSELMSITFLLTTLFFVSQFKNTKYKSFAFLTAISYLILVQIRVENFLFAIPIIIWLFKDRMIIKKIILKYYVIIIILLLLLIPLFLNVTQQNIVAQKDAINSMNPNASLSLADNYSNFKENIWSNILFWFENEINPLIISILFLVGLYFLWDYDKNLFWFATSLLVLFTIVYSIFTSDLSFSFGRHFRFTLVLYIPIIIVASFGISEITKLVNKSYKKPFFILLILFLIWVPFAYSDFISSRPHHNFEEYDFLTSTNLNSNCYMFTNRFPPTIFLLENKVVRIQDFTFKRDQIDTCAYIYLNPYVFGVEMDRGAYLQNAEFETVEEYRLLDGKKLEILLYKK